MKQGKGLQRRSRLVGDPEKHDDWQRRSRDAAIQRKRESPLRAVEPKPRKAPKATGEKAARDAVTQRSGGVCEIRVSVLCAYWALDFSHRFAKGKGGRWRASNGLAACRFCHLTVTNTNGRRAECVANGWILDRNQDPATTRVLIHGQWLLLADDGTTTPAEGAAA
jgi:hypothetical protein